MPATIPYNPLPTTTAVGSFTTQTDGGVQGIQYDDPATRFALRGGIVSQSETLPMFGGIGVSELVPTPISGTTYPSPDLGPILSRATTLTVTSSGGLTGFTVFNQAHNLVNSPESPVPLAASGMTINYVRLGSGARICVACDPQLVSLENGLVGANVSWDFNTQRLVPYQASTTTVSITSITWASTNGGQGTVVAGAATNVGAVGDSVFISGATNTGTGGNTVVNGQFIVSAFTDNQHFIIAMPAASGVIATIGGTILNNQSGAALACKIDRVMSGNSMVVAYSPISGFFTWNYSGTTADLTI